MRKYASHRTSPEIRPWALRSYLQFLQEEALQLLQLSPPLEEVKTPPLFTPKRENCFSTFLLRQCGQVTLFAADDTIFSKSLSQRPQRYS
jgi:hypothetical protein